MTDRDREIQARLFLLLAVGFAILSVGGLAFTLWWAYPRD